MEELSMILLTFRFSSRGDRARFRPHLVRIIVVIVVQIGLISRGGDEHLRRQEPAAPPDDRHRVRGVLAFNVALIALLAIVVAFPQLATFLPKLMK